MKESILKYALENAMKFGSVNPKVVLGRVLRDHPEAKKDVPGTLKLITETIKNVENLNSSEARERLEKIAPELLAHKEEEVQGPLKALPNAVRGKVVVRIAPSPSGPLHVGHAYGASLNYEYAKMYEGKFVLRIEDTNPENIYEKGYELIERDARWLSNNEVDSVVIQSERLGTYYDAAHKLVSLGKAYVCTCQADEWREKKNSGEACACRELSVEENQRRFDRMFGEYAPGEAVMRLKTNIEDKNPAMRDFGIMRINDHVHPRVGKEHRVWPLMVFSVAVDDHENGVTHVLNGKDHTDNAAKERKIMEFLGWKAPEYKHWGRINFAGMPLSSSKTRLAIEQKEFAGWDDPRLAFLPALRRRGYQPAAFRRFAIEVGLSLNDKTVAIDEFWKMINSFNKDIVEPLACRYFFVEDQEQVHIENTPEGVAHLDKHPDFPDKGQRNIAVNGDFYLAKKDLENLQEGIHRLMDCINFHYDGNVLAYHSDSYEDYKKAENKGKILHWVPVDGAVEMEVRMSDNSVARGVGEPDIVKINEGDIVQFERCFFARLDSKEKFSFWYLHQ